MPVIDCVDNDECATRTDDDCGPLHKCQNTAGSYVCVCIAGYHQSINDTECDDDNECDSDNNNCDVNAECINTDGSFKCKCLSGYAGDGTVCDNFDECSEGVHECHPDTQYCVDREGHYGP